MLAKSMYLTTAAASGFGPRGVEPGESDDGAELLNERSLEFTAKGKVYHEHEKMKIKEQLLLLLLILLLLLLLLLLFLLLNQQGTRNNNNYYHYYDNNNNNNNNAPVVP